MLSAHWDREKGVTRLLLVNEQELLRNGMTQLVERLDSDLEIDAVPDVETALALPGRKTYSIALIDMPDAVSEFGAALHRFRAAFPDTATYVVAWDPSPAMARACIEAGSMGYILSVAPHRELIRGLKRALGRKVYLAPVVLDAAFGGDRNMTIASVTEEPVRRVLERVLWNQSPEQIGRCLGMSVETVLGCRARAFSLLGVSCRTQALYVLAAKAREDG